MPLPKQPIKFYSFPVSGHAHRVELLLRALNLPFERIDMDLSGKQQKKPDFIRLNPFGQIPVIDDGGKVVWDSAAILVYLCMSYDPKGVYLPRDPQKMAEVVAWLGKAAGPINYGLATARRINIFKSPADMAAAQAIGNDFLGILENHLAPRQWLVADAVSIADFACYSYVAHAPEGGIDLAPYGHVTEWLGRFRRQPFFVQMARTKVGLWA